MGAIVSRSGVVAMGEGYSAPSRHNRGVERVAVSSTTSKPVHSTIARRAEWLMPQNQFA